MGKEMHGSTAVGRDQSDGRTDCFRLAVSRALKGRAKDPSLNSEVQGRDSGAGCAHGRPRAADTCRPHRDETIWFLNKNPTALRCVQCQGKMAIELHTLNLDDGLAIGVVEANTMSNHEIGIQSHRAMTENWAKGARILDARPARRRARRLRNRKARGRWPITPAGMIRPGK